MPLDGMAVRVCESCTCVSFGAKAPHIEDCYRARVWGGPPRAEFTEHDDGSIRRAAADVRSGRNAAKLHAFRGALRRGANLSASVLEVGCRDGEFSSTARERFGGLELAALEPWLPWRAEALRRGLNVTPATAESVEGGSVDIVVEFDLLDHFPAPVLHLQTLARLMKPAGHLVLGVSNVETCVGMLHPHRLRRDTPIGLTRRALRAACSAAGLEAWIWEDGPTLFAVCERGEAPPDPAPPGEAAAMALAFQENDGRLLLKRVLAEHGPTDAALRVAGVAARGCRSAHCYAALCLDVAAACDRGGRTRLAAQWSTQADARRSSQNVA
ncbi:MAG: class I SAM-dependent methyltransferase [Nannocystaceae bacterium]|nr:class I SAM-dependent methyltransferase [Nannocystaceae bacterium]